MSQYAVGDDVIVVTTGYSRSVGPTVHDGTVTKVGRKWVHVRYGSWMHDEQFNAESGAIKREFQPRAFLYPSREAYDDEVRRNTAWDEFVRVTRGFYTCPEHLSAEALEAMTKTLRGEP